MAKRKLSIGLVIGVGFLVCAALLTACAGDDPGCAQAVKADNHRVHDQGLWDSDVTLPGVTTPVATHWTAHAKGDPCSRAPGPTDWSYQTVVTLTHADAVSIARGWHWQPVAPITTPASAPGSTDDGPGVSVPSDLASQLAGYVPAGAIWTESQDYEADLPGSQWYAVFLDPDRDVMLVFAFDH